MPGVSRPADRPAQLQVRCEGRCEGHKNTDTAMKVADLEALGLSLHWDNMDVHMFEVYRSLLLLNMPQFSSLLAVLIFSPNCNCTLSPSSCQSL